MDGCQKISSPSCSRGAYNGTASDQRQIRLSFEGINKSRKSLWGGIQREELSESTAETERVFLEHSYSCPNNRQRKTERGWYKPPPYWERNICLSQIRVAGLGWLCVAREDGLFLSPRSHGQRLANMTSKLDSELVTKAVEDIVAYSKGETIKRGDTDVVGKKRKFMESIELQVSPSFCSIRSCYDPRQY